MKNMAIVLVAALALYSGQAKSRPVSEVAVKSGRKSFILSISMFNQSEVQVGDTIDEDELDPGNSGLGFTAEYGVNRNFGYELGLFNLKRRYVSKGGESLLAQEARRAHLPFLAKLWLWNKISLGLGPFVGLRTDGVRTAERGDVSGLETQADDAVEYGVETAAAVNIAFGDKTGVFLEGRWSEPFNQIRGVEINKFTALGGVKIEVDL